jgi:hypothetical protein
MAIVKMQEGIMLYNDAQILVDRLPSTLDELKGHASEAFRISAPVLLMISPEGNPVLLDSDQTYHQMKMQAEGQGIIVVEVPESESVIRKSPSQCPPSEAIIRSIVREELNVLMSSPLEQLTVFGVECSLCKSPQIIGTRYVCSWCKFSLCSMCELQGDHEHPLFKQNSPDQSLPLGLR